MNLLSTSLPKVWSFSIPQSGAIIATSKEEAFKSAWEELSWSEDNFELCFADQREWFRSDQEDCFLFFDGTAIDDEEVIEVEFPEGLPKWAQDKLVDDDEGSVSMTAKEWAARLGIGQIVWVECY